jgi:hypothetical protein
MGDLAGNFSHTAGRYRHGDDIGSGHRIPKVGGGSKGNRQLMIGKISRVGVTVVYFASQFRPTDP